MAEEEKERKAGEKGERKAREREGQRDTLLESRRGVGRGKDKGWRCF